MSKSISRIDSKSTHGYFARVYRGSWVGSRSFADGIYGGKSEAKAAAVKWVAIADERLPKIPRKPVRRKATVKDYADSKRIGLRFFQVYLPDLENDEGFRIEKRYYHKGDLAEKEQKRTEADKLAADRNQLLSDAHLEKMTAWYLEHDKIMVEIERIWPKVKTMAIQSDFLDA